MILDAQNIHTFSQCCQSLSDKQPALQVLLYTAILSKYVKYTAIVVLGKLKKYVHLLSFNSVKHPTAKLALVIALILSRKSFILERTLSLMHKIFVSSPNAVKLQVCNLTSVSFRRHFLVWSCAEHVKFCAVFVRGSFRHAALFRALFGLFLAMLLLCVCFFND